jgi:GAF domain-containing protein
MSSADSTPGTAWLEESDQVRLLLDISRAVTSTLDLEHVYRVTLDRLHDLIPFEGAVFGILAPGGWIQAAARRPSGIGEGTIERLPGWAESEWVRRIAGGEAFFVDDVRGDHPLAVEYRAFIPQPIEQSPMRYFRSILEVPLVAKGAVVGSLVRSASLTKSPGFSPKPTSIS